MLAKLSCVCVITVMTESNKKNLKKESLASHIHEHLSRQTHSGALIHCREKLRSVTGLTLGSTGLGSYWDPSLCAHTASVTLELFVCVFPNLWRV